MKLGKILLALAFALTCGQAAAFQSKDEQIDYILSEMQSATQARKEQLLENLQWSGLSDPRLFDVFESNLLQQYQERYLPGDQADLMAYQVRALGYSGNSKYRETLALLAEEAKNSTLKRHAKKAKRDLDQFILVQNVLSRVPVENDALPYEISTYIRMLETDHSYTQRLAARAIYHEQRNNKQLLDLTAEKLRGMYLDEQLNELAQDTAAWMAKVLKQHSGYEELLTEVAEKTPHRKIERYAE